MKKYIKPAVRYIYLSEESALMTTMSSEDLDGVTYGGDAQDNIRVDSNRRGGSIWDNE